MASREKHGTQVLFGSWTFAFSWETTGKTRCYCSVVLPFIWQLFQLYRSKKNPTRNAKAIDCSAKRMIARQLHENLGPYDQNGPARLTYFNHVPSELVPFVPWQRFEGLSLAA